jgi:predicted TIM-barrel enzyme
MRNGPFSGYVTLLKEVKDLDFTGAQNFPTVNLIDGVFRQNLEEIGMSYEMEVEMIKLAHESDLLTTPYVFNVNEEERMTRTGS